MQGAHPLASCDRKHESEKEAGKVVFKVIALYLFVVLSIVVLCYSKIPFVSGFVQINIPPNIMITILSTTTVNIIGLGLIVLRGHFLANDKSNNVKDNNE